MTRTSVLASVLVGGLTLVGMIGEARAGLLPVNVSINQEGANYRWTYAIVLPTDSQLQSGNYFTIYDFNGYIPDSNFQPEGWEFTVSNVGPTPDMVTPDDDPTRPNLSWRYVGENITTGQTGLGNFWALSLYDSPTDSFFTARTNRSSDGRIDTNITSTTVPVPNGPPPVVPEPGTLVLAGLGLPLVGLIRLARNRR